MKNKDTRQNAVTTIGYIFEKISDFEYEPIRDYLKNLNVDIEAVKLRFGLGFAHKKVYIDLLECYYKDSFDGHLTLYILLHEIGHVLRVRADKDLQERLETDDFEVYFADVLIEEEAADYYATNQFKLLTGVDVSPEVLSKQADLEDPKYKQQMETVFNKKKLDGSWDVFLESIIDRDFEFRTKDISWNTMYEEEERMVRACIHGCFYNAFNIPDDRDVILFNPFTFKGIRANKESMDDYNEKDVMMMNPFNSKYTSKASYENGEVVEAYKAEDGKWVPIDLETLRKEE
jgi:hypothetical protein